MKLRLWKFVIFLIFQLFTFGTPNVDLNPDEMMDKLWQQSERIAWQNRRIAELEGMLDKLEDLLNPADDLEVRVSALEVSMGDVESDLDDVESVNLLQDQRIILIEANVQDNEQDIEGLDDATGGLQGDISGLQSDVTSLDQRVGDLESGGGGGGGGNANVSALEDRVEALEGVTLLLTDETNSQGNRISGAEQEVISLEERIVVLETTGGSDYGDTIFMAAQSYPTAEWECPAVFSRDVINDGGHYSDETGLYTVPRNGIYQFHVQMMSDYYDKSTKIGLLVDGSVNGSHNDQYSHLHYRSLTVLLDLQEGQTVGVCREGGTWGSSTYLHSYFHGYMIAAN